MRARLRTFRREKRSIDAWNAASISAKTAGLLGLPAGVIGIVRCDIGEEEERKVVLAVHVSDLAHAADEQVALENKLAKGSRDAQPGPDISLTIVARTSMPVFRCLRVRFIRKEDGVRHDSVLPEVFLNEAFGDSYNKRPEAVGEYSDLRSVVCEFESMETIKMAWSGKRRALSSSRLMNTPLLTIPTSIFGEAGKRAESVFHLFLSETGRKNSIIRPQSLMWLVLVGQTLSRQFGISVTVIT
ncbi:hypothetical protein BC829DRAFT_487727, partial [Chytridium lagenaria]